MFYIMLEENVLQYNDGGDGRKSCKIISEPFHSDYTKKKQKMGGMDV